MTSKMDEVVQQLESAAISNSSEREESRFEGFYKNRGKTGNQDERRKDLLENQKHGRNYRVDKSRGILELVRAADDDIFRTPKSHWKPTVYVQGFREIANYCHVLTGSEWLLEKPHDFAENWLVTACPKGVRMLVIAYKGITKCFNKYGNYRFECRTALPGGNPCEIKSNQNTCVLDCFYSKETSTMFVLDILAWNNCVMTEGEAAFRQYWMVNHLEAIPELKLCTKKNKMIFKVLPKVPCTTESLNKFLSVYPYFDHNEPPVDGLLFYHSKAQYFPGDTPLIGWLYPYMLPEVLGPDITIHQAYHLEKPIDYVSYLDFIEAFEARASRKKQKRIFARRSHEENAEEENAAESMSVATNSNTDTAEAQGDNQITTEGTMETDNVQVHSQGDNTSARKKKGAKKLNKPATMEAETSADPASNKIDEMESMVADIVTEDK